MMRFVAYPVMQKALQNSLIQNLEGVGHKQAESVKRWMDERIGDSKVITNNPLALLSTSINETDEPFPELLKDLRLIKNAYGYKEIFVTDITGMIRIATDEWKVGTYVSGFEYFHEALKGKTFISKVEPSVVPIENEHGELEPGVPTMFVSSPIRDKNIITGVVCMRIDFMQISKLMRSIKLGESGETYLINRDGVMLTESRFVSHLKEAGLIKKRSALELKVVTPKTEELTKGVKECLKGKEGFDGNGYLDYRGAKVLGFWQWIPELQWGVISEIDVNEGYRAIHRLKKNIYIILAGGMIAAIVVSIALAKMVSEPILRLTDATRKMAAGDLSQRVQNRADDEIGALANSFNIMAGTINKRNEELQAAKLYLEKSLVETEGEKSKLETILLNIGDGVVVGDASYNLLFMNPVAEKILGKRCKDLQGKDFFGCHREGDRVMKMIKHGQLPVSTKINYDSYILHINATAIKNVDGSIFGYTMIVRDVTEQERMREKLEELAVTDGLTGAYNHKYFQEHLGYEFERAKRYNTPLSLIMVDIDYFKNFNDQFGHQLGDEALIGLARLLKDNLRHIDTVARYGGEEFILILPNTDEKECFLLAERLRTKTECYKVKGNVSPLGITISLGLATFNGMNFNNKVELIKAADDALYIAKRGGRNRVEVATISV
ncbi:MAG: diguanylate cyclase [Candidatus Brocadiales bacterium]|nr:diguanylate cyclase [Candidatus Brocadiales bacterium]